MTSDELIAAMACAPGIGGRSIIRLSGRGMFDVLDSLMLERPRLGEQSEYQSHRAYRIVGRSQIKLEGQPITVNVSAYCWPSSRSFTGQPSAELQVAGSPAICESLLNRVFQYGARPARKGEFTLRAFLAGHVDLMQAEAVLGTIDAADHEELGNALRQLAGGVSGRIRELRSELLNLLADLEAGLDFVDEDISFVSQADVLTRLGAVQETVVDLLKQSQDRMHLATTQRVVLVGDPNSGKSTLFNRLVGTDAAMVSPVAGTTRDYLRGRVTWRGTEFELIDTAGWERIDAGIDGEAQSLRTEQVRDSDFLIWCIASDTNAVERAESLRRFEDHLRDRPNAVLAITKCDLTSPGPASHGGSETAHASDCEGASQVELSALTCEGIDRLLDKIHDELAQQRRGSRDFIGSTAARASTNLHRAQNALTQAIAACDCSLGDEVVAVEIHDTLDALGEIVGAVVTDDLLDRIFSRFCIGK